MFSILGAAALLALAACTATPTPGSSTSGPGGSAGSSIICPDPGSSIVTPSDVYCNITFKDGDSIIGSQAVKKGEKATSYTPSKDGYIPLDGTEVSTKYSAKVGGKTFGGETENATSAWAYGTGNKNGFLNYTGLYSIQRGARLRYTPVENYTTGDMDVTVKLAPGKTAGQGFGSDYQYLDTMIKFNTGTLTGYGLRIYRRSGDSCEFVLMQYKDGLSKEITDPIQSSTYLTEVTVHLWTEGTKFNAHVESSKPQPETAKAKGYAEKVDLTADIAASSDNGFCLISTSTVGDNTTYIGSIDLNWKKAAW